MSDTMHKGLIHGVDFFDYGSSESECEDSVDRLTQTFTSSSGPGLRDRPYDINSDDRSAPRGRSRYRSTITSLPNTTSLPVRSSDYSGVNEEHTRSPVDDRGTSHARQVSLRRLNKENVRLVDNRSIRSSIDSPRHSILSNYNNSLPAPPAYSISPFTKSGPFPSPRILEDTLTPLPRSPTFLALN